jgi:hypothetical protein
MRSRRRALVLLGLALVSLGLAALSCRGSSSSHKVGVLPGQAPQASAFSYQSGSDAATVVVPPSTFVTSIWAVGGDGGGTVVITPASQFSTPTCTSVEGGWVDGGCADGAILEGGACDAATRLDAGWSYAGGACVPASTVSVPVPAGQPYLLGRPVLNGASNELGDGTEIDFTNVASYSVTQLRYGP